MLIQDIDWEYVEAYLGTTEMGDPEAIVHEVAHFIDATGDLKIDYIGRQSDVSSLIEDVFATDHEKEDAEIRATAITIATLRSLGANPDPLQGCLKLMLMNLPQGDEERRKSCLMKHISSLDIQEKASAILSFFARCTNEQLEDS